MVIPPAEVNAMEDRLAELETRIAFQDNTIQALNEVIIRQQDKLDQLEQVVALLKDRVNALQPPAVAPMDEETPPPHY
jgi:SlyX protein